LGSLIDVDEDTVRADAVRWFRLAATQGHAGAAAVLRLLDQLSITRAGK
jgi:TPR repeat protein